MTHKLISIYQKLYSHFGPQHWWPGKTPFEVMVGTILTQNTNWRNTEKAIDNLKKHRLLAPDKLYRLSHQRLALLIKSAGYYNIKARRLISFLNFFVKYYKGNSGKMSSVDTLNLRRQLLSINGIGPETADSILLYALDKPIFVVDAYTKRILSRHHFIKENATYEEVQDLFMKSLKSQDVNHVRSKSPKANNASMMRTSNVVKLFNEYHALLVKLGKEFCLKRSPKCEICPLK